ncbi:MAG: ABC transporter ATP-binding protein [Candidatus Sumerlaeia bacterium]
MIDQQQGAPAIALRGVVKRFRQTVANDGVTLDVRVAEAFALVGENGAGKTTLMNILSGYFKPDAGRIELFGEPVAFRSPAEAIARGVGMVHQHFMLISPFTVLENIILGSEPVRWGGALDLQAARARVENLIGQFQLPVPLDARVQDLDVGSRQRVEILKALYRRARILILDEPTAVLTPQEVDKLFAVLRRLKARGTTIVFITHKLPEALELADRIGVMRRGRLVAVCNAAAADAEQLAALMVGRSLVPSAVGTSPVGQDTVLEVRNVSLRGNARGQTPLHGISFEVRSGEIFGLAGVLGNGQRELELILTGAIKPDGGEIRFLGTLLPLGDPAACLRAGIAHIPEDRQRQGLATDVSVAGNLILGRHAEATFCRRGLLRRRAVRLFATGAVRQFDVRPPRPDAPARHLSGGNQQKVVVAREMLRGARLLIAAHPTRGVDIGAIQQIHSHLVRMRDGGGSIVLISADLSELLKLCDRIGVMFEGRLAAVLPVSGLTERKLGVLMTGGAGRTDGSNNEHDRPKR